MRRHLGHDRLQGIDDTLTTRTAPLGQVHIWHGQPEVFFAGLLFAAPRLVFRPLLRSIGYGIYLYDDVDADEVDVVASQLQAQHMGQ